MSKPPASKRRRVELSLEDKISLIRESENKPKPTLKFLSEKYGVGKSTVGDILKHKDQYKGLWENAVALSTNGQKKTNALHFDVRFDYGRDHDVVIRNSKIDGKWGQQENSMCRPFPFKHNDFFEVIFLVEKSCFKVAVNDQHFIEYEHRFPIEDIDTLRIRGDVRLTSVRVQG